MEQLRWNGNVVSPFDEASKVYKTARGYKCKNTGKYFNVRTQTLFDNTKIELQSWFIAIYLVTGHKKGISSLQLGRDLNVTQKTAWFMLQRIRNCFGIDAAETDIDNNNKLGGSGIAVEVDDTIVGGKVKNMTNKKRKSIAENKNERWSNKTTMVGYLERQGRLRLQAVNGYHFIPDLVRANVDAESVLMTDTANTFYKVGKDFAYHGVVDHGKKQYTDGINSTNGIEGVFSLFDRMVIGIYHYVSPKHLQKYANEFSFRYNSRKTSDLVRFNTLLSNCTNRLTYNQLTK
ncbi:IS1595 family transposase [Mucilaginibacter sp. KACC 22063]|uniref:IS1595 family transposase n=1 Tax=Mucilaginibacter sp. KACC 22063 TaxID=3025666 RepID=UPI00236727C0|nr:IS1595 family transposase [Mucilaginibacter sp. KACC 22063]WDF54946.1 IS1595 family transposase [Mucilaginibacter sp. KACC 22063]